MNAEAIGKTYPPFEYELGKEKIREYARAVGEDNPVYFDRAAAREAGFRDVAAPPMFAVVYSWGAVALPAVDPEVDLNFAMLVHGGQEFDWGEPVCSGDVISTVATREGHLTRRAAWASTCSRRSPRTRTARRSRAARGPTS